MPMRDWGTEFRRGTSTSSTSIVAGIAEIAGFADSSKSDLKKKTVYNNSNISCFESKQGDHAIAISAISAIPAIPATLASEKPTPTYITQRMAELGLTKEDVRGETDSSLALDPEELNDIRNNKQLFDIWVEHVHRHKQLKALEIAKQKQAEEYHLSDTLGSLPFDHKLKFVEHVLITFKKFFVGDKYAGWNPNKLFIEIWFLANEALTLGQIFDASAELIRLAKQASNNGDNAEFKRLQSISENAEYFRQFCVKQG